MVRTSSKIRPKPISFPASPMPIEKIPRSAAASNRGDESVTGLGARPVEPWITPFRFGPSRSIATIAFG